MKNLFASTAIAIALATTAYGATPDASPFVPTVAVQGHYASELIGARLYVSEVEVGDDVTEVNKDWNDVGEINDIILGADGQVEAVLADIGGFLGIGEKQIAMSMENLRFVRNGDDSDDYFVVVQSSQAMLENAPVFEWDKNAAVTKASMSNATDATAKPAVAADAATTTAPASDDAVLGSTQRDYRFTPPAITRDGFEAAAMDKLTTEEVTGAAVYDANDEWIGEVNSIMLDQNGKLGDAIIDVGGFLGIGEKPVAVSFEELTIQRGTNGGELRIYVDATKEQLEKLPEAKM